MRFVDRSPSAPGDAATLPLAGAAREYCVIDFYGPDGHWLDSLRHDGCADHVAPDLHDVAARLAARPCAAIVLRHYHPSGRALPSAADIAATRAFARFVQLLGARLHDHLILADGGCFSFRAAGLF
jgi:DNA repair protein RadC